MKKVNNYFSHDFNARNDIKLKKLNMQLGLQGIGLYWCIIECLYENNGYLTLDDDVDLLVYDLKVDRDLIINLIDNFDLFKKCKNKFYSQSVLNRLQKITDKSNKNRINVIKRWNKSKNENNTIENNLNCESDTNVLPNEYQNNATEEQTNYYIKENKKKEKKKEENKRNILLTTTTNSNTKDSIYTQFEKNFGRLLSPMEYQKINNWLELLDNQDDILEHAIEIAVMNNIPTFAYVDGIIKNWNAKNLKTLKQIKDSETKNQQQRQPLSKEKLELLNELSDYNWLEDD